MGRWPTPALSPSPPPRPQYDAFLSGHGAGRRHSSLAEYRARAALFEAHAAFIAAHNSRGDAPFTMAMNRCEPSLAASQ